MKTYVYRATIERGELKDWVASFPDVPEAITQADTIQAARDAAQDALGLALLSYPARSRPLPSRSFGLGHPPVFDSYACDVDVAPLPEVTAKLAVLEAFAASGRTREEVGVMMGGRTAAEVQDILEPFAETDIQTLAQALEVLGQRLVVGVSPMIEAA